MVINLDFEFFLIKNEDFVDFHKFQIKDFQQCILKTQSHVHQECYVFFKHGVSSTSVRATFLSDI